MPGLIGASDPGKPPALAVNLDRVRLVQPAFRITRTQQGILLPPLRQRTSPRRARPRSRSAAAGAPAASAAPAPEIRVEVAEARIEGGRAQIVDRTVQPFYNSKIDQLDLKARGIRWPGPVVQNLVLGMRGLQGATLDVRGSIGPGDSKLDVKLVELPLAPFNPYVTASGYSLAGGTLSFDSKAKVERESYDTSSQVVVSQLDVGGAEGESLFQENFGIPLSVALGLLKDLDGNIKLAVPVAGDRGGVKVGLGEPGRAGAAQGADRRARLAAQALRRDHGRRQGAEPRARADRLRCPDARRSPKQGSARIEQLAGLLSASPGIALTLRGATAPRGRALAPGAGAARGAARDLGPARARQARRDRHARARCASIWRPASPARTRRSSRSRGPGSRRRWSSRASIPRGSRRSPTRAPRPRSRRSSLNTASSRRVSALGPPVSEAPAAVPGVTIALGALPRASP